MTVLEKLLLLYYFVIGNILGRLLYPKSIFQSCYFSRPGSKGWSWISKCIISQKIFGYNRSVPWPCSPLIQIIEPCNIKFHPDDLNNFMTAGCYYQAIGRIVIGKGCFIAPNVGLITQNHDLNDPFKRGEIKEIILGEKCWIGMNSLILPGVKLGPHTVVGGVVL